MKTMIKKLLFITVLLISFTSCNTDDSEKRVTSYSVTIEKSNCGGAKTTYCITKTEKDRIQTLINNNMGEPCVWISIKDINGSSHSGYYRSSGTDSENACG